jgi:hypothetical protein
MIAVGGWAGTPLSGSPFQESFLHRMCGMVNAFVTQTYKHFQFVEDPRVNRGANYPLMELIFVTLCAVIYHYLNSKRLSFPQLDLGG